MNNHSLMYLNEEVHEEVFQEDTLEKILIDSDILVVDTVFENQSILNPVSSESTVKVEVSESVHEESLEDLTELDKNLSCLQDTSSNRSTISSRETPSQVVYELHPDFLQITPGKCETY